MFLAVIRRSGLDFWVVCCLDFPAFRVDASQPSRLHGVCCVVVNHVGKLEAFGWLENRVECGVVSVVPWRNYRTRNGAQVMG